VVEGSGSASLTKSCILDLTRGARAAVRLPRWYGHCNPNWLIGPGFAVLCVAGWCYVV
jgi:hypothetical protein